MSVIPKIFYIPEKVECVVVSDMFAENYLGGAELTLEAILKKSPKTYMKVYSGSVTADLVEKYKNKHWIIVNFSQVPHEALIELVTSQVKFSVIECDYKYCKWRSSHLHFLKENRECDCQLQRHGRFIRALYDRANKVFFMGQGQLDEYNRLFPQTPPENFFLLGSTFTDETLDHIKNLRQQRKANEKYAILKGGSWIKAENQTVKWCEENNIDYELVGGLSHEDFLTALSKYKGLVFRPAGYDTAPRIVIESKLLGLVCILNGNVQNSKEKWFLGSIQEAEEYLRTRAETFWNIISDEEKRK